MHCHENAESDRVRVSAPRAPGASFAGKPPELLRLQAGVGNAAVVQMLHRSGHPAADPGAHEHAGDCEHQAALPAVQRSAVHDVLRSGGRPLDEGTRSDMEARLGADFSNVRIHTDAAARASAAEVGAHAYTSGSHVVIGAGGGDRHTLAHELTHVIQQRQGPVAGTDNGSGLKVSDPSDRFEREAEANARRVLSMASVQRIPAETAAGPATGAAPAGTVQRVVHQEPSYVAEVANQRALTNRGDIEVEVSGGEECVRVYQTVFQPVPVAATKKGFKDIHQGGDGVIDLVNQKDGAWLNMGRPWRSMHYMRTYQEQKNRSKTGGAVDATTTSMVRSFLIPLHVYRQVTNNAVSEAQTKDVTDTRKLNQNVDKSKDSDQYEVRGEWLQQVAAYAVSGSLVTYVPDHLAGGVDPNGRNGRIEPISVLLGRLGMPDFEDFPEYRTEGDREGGLVVSLEQEKKDKQAQEKQIELLTRLHSDAFGEKAHPAARKRARAQLQKLARVTLAEGDAKGWETLRDRVERALNYVGMPTALETNYKEANDASQQADGGGFKVRNFKNAG
ncbi:eCIS core domain-containing protein [Streptomyces anulatus]|uniref:eCIS core domain-containing protein n=1 Tax=Streptomyces anulatus TaxID=1892 RepID=UPI00356B714D